MHFYSFHIGDYVAATAHLDPLEDITYRRLMDFYYTHERAIPNNISQVARLIRLKEHADTVQAILDEFFTLTETGWTHSRCDEEIASMNEKSAKAREAAQASVAARKAKQEGVKPSAQRPLNERSTDVELPITHYPLPITQEDNPPVSPLAGGSDDTGDDVPDDSGTGVRGGRLPDDWRPDLDWAVQETGWPVREVHAVADRFRDYWVAVPGAKGRKLDWAATWRNWVRRELETRTEKAHAKDRDNSAVGKVRRAIAERDRKRQSVSGSSGSGEVYEGECFPAAH